MKRLLAPSFSMQETEAVWEGIHGSPQAEGYRNKMEFTFGDAEKDGPLELGLHRKRRFHDIVSVTDCRITDADFRLVLSETLSFFRAYYDRKEITYYHRKRQRGLCDKPSVVWKLTSRFWQHRQEYFSWQKSDNQQGCRQSS